MQKQIELIKITRGRFIQLVDGLSLEQLNEIPAGMSNNVAWNFGHIVAAQQSLCNSLSGLPFDVEPEYIANFKKGTKPEGLITREIIDQCKTYIVSNISVVEKGLKENAYTKFQVYTTSFGNTLNDIEDAIRFVAVHDALHLGYSMAIRKNLSIK